MNRRSWRGWLSSKWEYFKKKFENLNVEPEVLTPSYFLHSNEYNKFPIQELGEVIIDYYNRMSVTDWKEGYLWQSRVHDPWSNYKRGEVFETKVWEKIKAHEFKNDYILTNIDREIAVGKRSRADFILEWKICDNKILNVLIEAKHSVNHEDLGINRGLRQLHRYQSSFQEANLLVLLVDFRISGKLMSIRGEVIVINYQIFEEFMDLISNFVNEKRRKEFGILD